MIVVLIFASTAGFITNLLEVRIIDLLYNMHNNVHMCICVYLFRCIWYIVYMCTVYGKNIL